MTDRGNVAGASSELVRLMSGFWFTAVAHALADLGVPDALGDSERGSGDVAAEIGVHGESLFRLLRAAAALDLVRHHGGERFSLASMGHCLRADTAGSVRGMALHMGGDIYRAFGDLAGSVRSGRPPDWIKYGPDGFAELNEDAEAAAVFNQAMVDGSRRIAGQAVSAYDFSRFPRIMDVGGGYGAVLAVLLQNNPVQTGSILDLPHSAGGARAYLEKEGVADRARYITGSFFEEVPAEADCYILKFIIHDWADDYAREILTRCAQAARQTGGVVVLLERIVPERIEAGQGEQAVLRGDLTMMLWGGKERTGQEYRSLFHESGLELTDIVPLPDYYAVIEARPV